MGQKVIPISTHRMGPGIMSLVLRYIHQAATAATGKINISHQGDSIWVRVMQRIRQADKSVVSEK